MIETYKIVTGKYEGCVAPSLINEEIYVTRGNDFRLQKLRLEMTYVNLAFATEWLIHGIVYLTGLFLLMNTFICHKKQTLNNNKIKKKRNNTIKLQ